MADNDNQQSDKELIIQQDDKPASASYTSSASSEKAQPVKHPSHTGLWLMILLTLCIALGVGAAGYWFVWKKGDNSALLMQEQTQQQQALAALNGDNQQLQKQLVALEQSKQALAETVNTLTSKTEAMQLQTEQLLSQLNDMEGRRPSDWLIAEADYLVRMAGRKVWLEKDTDTAVLLLQNADDRLKELSDPSIIPIRGLIAEDIQTLRNVNQVDKVKLALTLSGLLNSADKLPLHEMIRPKDEAEKEALSESVSDWQANLAKVWNDIVDDFITVSHTDAPVTPMMSAEEKWLYAEQLKLQIMQAQSAALNGEAELYRQSLHNAVTLLNDKFDKDSAKVQGALSALQSLADTDVAAELPSTLQAMDPLQRLLDKRVNRAFGNSAEAS